MREAKTFPVLEDAWTDVLSALGKVWMRTIDASKANKTLTGKWRVSQETLRRSDSLLCYLHHARNVDQHTVADAVESTPASYGIAIPVMPGGTYIDHLEIRGGQVVSYRGNAPIQRTYTPARIALLAVTDRGVTYQPPTNHMGVPLKAQTPLIAAELGVKYMAAMIEELRAILTTPK
jgi:hypothetical protein